MRNDNIRDTTELWSHLSCLHLSNLTQVNVLFALTTTLRFFASLNPAKLCNISARGCIKSIIFHQLIYIVMNCYLAEQCGICMDLSSFSLVLMTLDCIEQTAGSQERHLHRWLQDAANSESRSTATSGTTLEYHRELSRVHARYMEVSEWK